MSMSSADPQWLLSRLLAWYRAHARDLPWRRTGDPYAVWVSEIMLQQTQVATVVDYFQRFMSRFGTIAELAAADEQEVLRYWEGLGYYRRARSLHAAARRIVAEYGGAFPREFQQVMNLPGIGRYTAGAILSIAFDQRHPILEANTERLYCRWLALRGDPRSGAGRQQLWDFATTLVTAAPANEVGQVNQALMELGASICTPRSPACLACPVAEGCPTRAGNWQQEIPRPKPKQVYTEVTEATVVLARNGRYLVRRCQPGERWAGLWDFPRCPVASDPAESLEEQLRAATQRLTGIEVELGPRFATIRHGVTRFRITLHCHLGRPRGTSPRQADQKWATLHQLQSFPLSVTGRRIWQRLTEMRSTRHGVTPLS